MKSSAKREHLRHRSFSLCVNFLCKLHLTPIKEHCLFQDEIDALGVSRAGSDGISSHEGVLTTLLNEMDGIQELAGVTVVAATNRPDVLVRRLSFEGLIFASILIYIYRTQR